MDENKANQRAKEFVDKTVWAVEMTRKELNMEYFLAGYRAGFSEGVASVNRVERSPEPESPGAA